MVPAGSGEWIFDFVMYLFTVSIEMWYVIFALSFLIVNEVTIMKQVFVGSVQIQSDVFAVSRMTQGQCFDREWLIFAQ